jgi:hypothetical protein
VNNVVTRCTAVADVVHICTLFGDYAILALSFGLAPRGGIHMQFVKGKPPETQYASWLRLYIKGPCDQINAKLQS